MAQKFPSTREYAELLQSHASGIHWASRAGEARCDVIHRESKEITITGRYFKNKPAAEKDTMARLAKRKAGSSIKALNEEIDEKDAVIRDQERRIAELEGREPDDKDDPETVIGDDTPLVHTDLPVGIAEALTKAGIGTVGLLTANTEARLGLVQGIGSSSINKINLWLDEHGLGLHEEDEQED